jgi:hypothetical protein
MECKQKQLGVLLTRESTLLFTQSKQTLTEREPEKRIKQP